ncbi:hypothetical protein Lfu02_26820 [Longispora fulva]|uniref:DUF4190 domain-containing protein n=1 Tax=Longispora fulva TaxID=619741 RepID=A0A8J7GQQ6_9ACTN|nr:DUF4190 domain-containing protein [Longispora fulva]MBG6138815.1 hypothetical protein [Longispora fulva]GIG58310.1 hypothetical protein Lfu02_26820 [Longispora fulva]
MTYPHPQNDPYQQGAPQNSPDPLDFQVPTPYGYQQQPPAQPGYPGYDQQAYPQYDQPYSAPPVTGGPYMPYQQQPYGPPRANGMALASMIVSICALGLVVCCSASGLVGAVGAILGHVARKQIRERGEAGAGKALAGIICGWIAFGLFFVMVAVALIMYPGDIAHVLNPTR